MHKNKTRAGNTISIEFTPNPSLREEFIKYKELHNFHNHFELFSLIWEEFTQTPKLTNEEKEKIEQAAKLLGESMQDFKKRAILKAANRIIKAQEKPISEEEIDITSKTSSRAADLRVDTIVKEMMQHNDKATEQYERRFISQRAISEYAQEQRKKSPDKFSLNMNVIKRYLTKHQEVIDAHHAKYNLDKNHNREAFKWQREQYFAAMKDSRYTNTNDNGVQ